MNTRFPPVAGVAVALALVLCARLDAADWLPIDPAELAAEKSPIDPEAGAEILFHEHVVDAKYLDASKNEEYYRIKIYNEHGLEALGKIEIQSENGTKITNVSARVIKRDGTIAIVDRNAIFTQDKVRAGKMRVRTRLFSFPGLEPGVIVEYRWSEFRDGRLESLLSPLQSLMPTRKLRFRVRPLGGWSQLVKPVFHRCESKSVKTDKEGFLVVEVNDMPAVKKELYSPPKLEYQSWILFKFTLPGEAPDGFWQRMGSGALQLLEKKAQVRREFEAAVVPIIAGAKDDAEKLARIHDFCRSKIRNIELATAEFTPDQIASLKPVGSAADTLQRKYGTGTDINVLFVALARAAGFDACFVLSSNREQTFFDPNIMWAYALPDLICGVRKGVDWQFFDPASIYVPSGSLCWQNEGVQALALGAEEFTWVKTPITPAALSRTIRTARLTLSKEGTLEGDVVFQFGGQEGVEVKRDFEEKSPDEYEDLMRDRLRKCLSAAEVSDVEIKNVADPIEPVSMHFHIRVPGYATLTGRRLFFQPSFFHKGDDPVLTASTRDHGLYFSYPWTEEDVVSVSLPAGFALEDVNSPPSLPKGDYVNFSVQIVVASAGDRVRLTRTFELRPIYFGKDNYQPLKSTFDVIHASDTHTFIARRSDDPANSGVEAVSATSSVGAVVPVTVPLPPQP